MGGVAAYTRQMVASVLGVTIAKIAIHHELRHIGKFWMTINLVARAAPVIRSILSPGNNSSMLLSSQYLISLSWPLSFMYSPLKPYRTSAPTLPTRPPTLHYPFPLLLRFAPPSRQYILYEPSSSYLSFTAPVASKPSDPTRGLICFYPNPVWAFPGHNGMRPG